MGDRNNPIKFGPEWLRNLPGDRREATSSVNNQNGSPASGSGGASVGTASNHSPHNSNVAGGSYQNSQSSNIPKVHLAKLRYGREEMLALYDKYAPPPPPPELKTFELLYKIRGTAPIALSNTFEDDMRESIRSLAGMMPATDRYPQNRGRGMNASRGINQGEARGGRRGTSTRQPGIGRNSGYNGEDEHSTTMRAWSTPVTSNGQGVLARGISVENPDWPARVYRSKRPDQTRVKTNWRQSSRDDSEEWRSGDPNKNRPADKWERDRGERRRVNYTWDPQASEDALPEWAVENTEGFAGCFDASGAFHGYSNDDSDIPKTQESPYPLTKSHTHGSFARSKTADEGSTEWWSSEKAKKLSPKRFDASDIQYKKPNPGSVADGPGPSNITNVNRPNLYKEQPKIQIMKKGYPITDKKGEQSGSIENSVKETTQFTESKTYDSLLRSDINIKNASNENGNFQSVMITPNNSLRQKHQNIVTTQSDPRSNDQYNNKQQQQQQQVQQQSQRGSRIIPENTTTAPIKSPEESIVNEMLGMSLGPANYYKLPKLSEQTSREDEAVAKGVAQLPNSMQMPKNPMDNQEMDPINSYAPDASVMKQPEVPQMVGIQNSALNASLGLPMPPNHYLVKGIPHMPMQPAMNNPNMIAPALPDVLVAPTHPGMPSNMIQSNLTGLPAFQGNSNVVPGISTANGNSSLFFNQNNSGMQNPSDMQIPSQYGQNMFPMHGLQQSNPQAAFGNSMYSGMMQPPTMNTNAQSLMNQWYYEDPAKNIQGPFSSKDMYEWYKAGFFNQTLMVRRACDTIMRPLGSYGAVVPFAQPDMMSNASFPMANFDQGPVSGQNNMMNNSTGLGRNVDSLWGEPATPADFSWMQAQSVNSRNNNAQNDNLQVNNLPPFFWTHPPSAVASNSLLPEVIAKDMKTEDQILAHLRASQPPFTKPTVSSNLTNSQDTFTNVSATPNLEELQKLILNETSALPPPASNETVEQQAAPEKSPATDPIVSEPVKVQLKEQNQVKAPESKTAKPVKPDNETKNVKSKETNNTKSKAKKSKEEKKEEPTESKTKGEDPPKVEKRSAEPSPSQGKKDDKSNSVSSKKALDKDKKGQDWLKDGFVMARSEKVDREAKRKAEEILALEETERRRKEEERLAAEEEKKKIQAENLKKQQQLQEQQQAKRAAESVLKKAPWSAVTNQTMQSNNKEGLSLADIQRLEREKKMEQIKEQQHMMQIIAQQQAAALAREQEIQAGVGWAKKKGTTVAPTSQSLTDIQAETWKQTAALATAMTQQALEEPQTSTAAPALANHVAAWGNAQNGGGFWDTQPNQQAKQEKQEKSQEATKPADSSKAKKKVSINNSKKDNSPTAEFENWCTSALLQWGGKIDVPTFVGFLKDIESPYEVKDYVRCYLGDTKESNDFSRQFLERRSKLLRVGMVTPSDDLCSPAIAINPRAASLSEYQEVKGKGKKTKKNKMLKVDARILGFSVTASEDRINVGDIDTV